LVWFGVGCGGVKKREGGGEERERGRGEGKRRDKKE